MSRREALAAFLGLPFATWACRRAARHHFDGRIVGGAADFGHRLRAGIAAPPGPRLQTGVAIIGAGVAGLAAAWRLAAAGVDDFVVLELESEAGGTARSGASPVSPYPWGAHYINAPMAANRAMVRLLSEMGVLEGVDDEGEPIVGEGFLCREPEERVFYKGRWYEGLYLRAGASAEDLRQLAAFEREVGRWAAFRDGRGRRAFAIPSALGSDAAEVMALDKITMAAWLTEHGFTSPRLLWLVDYACRDDYGARPDAVSAWAGLFYFAARLARPGARTRPVVTWPEGNGRLVKHLLKSAGPRLLPSTMAFDVAAGEKSVTVNALCGDERAVAYEARHAIFCAPQFVAKHVVRGRREEGHADAFDYSPWMVANLTLGGRPAERGSAPSWDNVLYESPSLGYVTATHQRGRDAGPTQLTYYYAMADGAPRAARERLLAGDYQTWCDVVLSDLTRAHGDVAALTSRLDVMRWGHAMVRPRPGFISSPARREAARPRGALHFAHSDLSGVALFEEALYHGVRAAEAVLRERGVPLASWI